jgi:nitrogen fixation-related uncharacterized protein
MFAKLGLGGLIGALIGIAFVWWIEPTDAGGTGLLIVTPIAVGAVIGGIFFPSGKGKQSEGGDKEEPKGETSNGQTEHE